MLERAYPERLHGLLPRIYAGSNLEPQSLHGLINLFSKDVSAGERAKDMIRQVYEYSIGEFASSEGKRGGEYFPRCAPKRRWQRARSAGFGSWIIGTAPPDTRRTSFSHWLS